MSILNEFLLRVDCSTQCASVGFEKSNNTSGQLHANIYIQAFVDVIILAAISQYYNYTVVVCWQMCSYVVINETILGVENN